MGKPPVPSTPAPDTTHGNGLAMVCCIQHPGPFLGWEPHILKGRVRENPPPKSSFFRGLCQASPCPRGAQGRKAQTSPCSGTNPCGRFHWGRGQRILEGSKGMRKEGESGRAQTLNLPWVCSSVQLSCVISARG